ncbi:hypothetical protein [Dongia sedimenti]|uniref:Uncharacterized protein n=1 Tax=Dongia sedimenti TaxID=3064282 RepID=A0ABU0YUX5_9PROT|nr:hypothetical protein [Rhodospirillaceae bacterium R-7]
MSGDRDKNKTEHGRDDRKSDVGSRIIKDDRGGRFIDNVTDTVKPERPQPAKKEK